MPRDAKGRAIGWPIERNAMFDDRSGRDGGRRSAETETKGAAQEAVGDLNSKLAMAVRHVAMGLEIVSRQRELIVRLRDSGHSIEGHKKVLATFESTLLLFQHHERLIHKEIAEAKFGISWFAK